MFVAVLVSKKVVVPTTMGGSPAGGNWSVFNPNALGVGVTTKVLPGLQPKQTDESVGAAWVQLNRGMTGALIMLAKNNSTLICSAESLYVKWLYQIWQGVVQGLHAN